MVQVSEMPLMPNAKLMDAVRAIEVSCRRMAVVVGEDGTLLGTLTDGDVRRHLLTGGSLESNVSKAMNLNPLTANIGSPVGYLKDLMRSRNVVAIPLLDQEGKFSSLIHVLDLEQGSTQDHVSSLSFSFAVIMAGGEGTRLRPLTEAIPKPMVEIGGVPLLERQIQRLAKVGISRVYIAVNYLGHIIESYFRDGQEFGLEIIYLREQEKLGTAGALSLLPEAPDRPILVMNGDILTTSDLDSFFSFHNINGAKLTLAAIDHKIYIPYGVVSADGPFVTGLVEKPSQQFLCNAGIYAVSPEVLSFVQKGKFSNMTDVINLCLARKLPIAVFPVHEYWNDIGTPDDLKKARDFFASLEGI